MSAKSQADLLVENAAVVTNQTTPESITPTTLGGTLLKDIIDSMWNKVDNPLDRMQTFADIGVRTSAVADFIGQVGVQLDTNTYYISFGLGAGEWRLAANTQVQSDTYAVATGTDNYVVVLTPALAAYAAGNTFRILFTNANTGAATIAINGLPAKNIFKNGSMPLVAGDIRAGAIYTIIFDGTNFQLDNSGVATYSLYKKYVALLAQTGVLAPVPTALENTVGVITWIYLGVGYYRAICPGLALFTANKTFINLSGTVDGTAGNATWGCRWLTNEVIEVYTYSAIGVSANDELSNDFSSIEIRVYP